MIDFKKMKTTEKTYILVPLWNCDELQFALEISGEEGWKFLEPDDVSEEIKKNFKEEDLAYSTFFVSNFDADALGAIIPYIRYDMDIQAAHEEQDYQEMRKVWDGQVEIDYEEAEYEEDLISEAIYGDDDINDGKEPENNPDEYDDVYYDEEIPENDDLTEEYRLVYHDEEIWEDDLTEEEIWEYERKRYSDGEQDGRKYLGSTLADYVSRTCKEEAITMLIKENAEAIAEWLSDENARERIRFEYDDNEESLTRVARHGDSVLCEYTKSGPEIRLKKDETNDLGFIVDDVYEVISRYMEEFDARDENAPVRQYYSISPEEMEESEEEIKKVIEYIKNMDIFA